MRALPHVLFVDNIKEVIAYIRRQKEITIGVVALLESNIEAEMKLTLIFRLLKTNVHAARIYKRVSLFCHLQHPIHNR